MNSAKWQKVALGLMAVGWGGVVLAAYYFVHKPIAPGNAAALARLGVTLLGWLSTLILAHFLGRVIAPFLRDLPARERFALRVGLGLGALGVLLLLLGFLRGYFPWLAWLVVAAAVLPARRPFVADLRGGLPSMPSSRMEKLLAGSVLLFLGLIALRALAPPTAWDSLVYHLTGPKLYLEAGGVQHSIDIPYLGFPQWGSMLFLWGMALAGPELAQLMHFTFVLLTLALLPTLVNRFAPGHGWLAAALCLAVPTAALLAAWAYVEWMTMFAGLAAFVSVLHAGESEAGGAGPGWAALAGAMTGLASAAKYTALGLSLGLGLLGLLKLKSLHQRGAFVGAAILALAPFLLKNALLTGNPVYPFVFAGRFWDANRALWYGRPGTGMGLWQLVIAPWEATVWGIEGALVRDHGSYGATLGPLILVLIPLMVFGWRSLSSDSRGVLSGVLLVSGIGYGVWLAQLAYSGLLVQSRLLLPLLPFLSALAVAGFDALRPLSTSAFKPRFVMGAMVGLVLIFGLLEATLGFASDSPLAVIVGTQPKRDYLTARLGMHELAMEAVNELPPGSRVKFLWEPRSYYCAATVICEPDAILDRWWHLRQTTGDAAAIAAEWSREGVTHVLLYWPRLQTGEHVIRAEGFDPFTDQDWAELDRLVTQHLEPVVDLDGVYVLYRLK